MPILKILGNTTSRLANDFNGTDHGKAGLLVCKELWSVHATGKGDALLGMLEHVVEIIAEIPVHSIRTSARICLPIRRRSVLRSARSTFTPRASLNSDCSPT